METREFFAHYARSPWGLGSAFVAIGGGCAALALGAGPLVAVVVAAAAVGGGFALSLATGVGQKAVVAEGGREAAGRAADRMAAAREARSRLAALRLPGGAVAEARDLVVLEAGRLEESFARSGSYDPEAAQAVIDSLDLADAWMKERDEAATERRFELPDANPFPQAAERTASALKRKAAIISEGRSRATGEVPPADRMAIEEELK